MILITGARGFLGRYCVRGLSKLDEPLFLTTSDKNACGRDGDHVLHYLNLEEPESLNNLPEDVDTVLHLAALIPKKGEELSFSRFMKVNADGVKKLIKAVAKRGCKQFVYASTQMVIEKPIYNPVDEDHPLTPISDYGLSKAVGERYCLSYAKTLNINVTSLRFAGIYGANQPPGYVLTIFIDRAMNGLPLIVSGTGKVRRELLYVKDAARAILCTLNSNISGIFNIGEGKGGVSIKELAEGISDVFSNGKSLIEYKEDLKDEGEDFYMNVEKAKRELGFIREFDLRKGLLDYKLELSLGGKQ